ncbi:hypothetical protein EVB32_162 [Rhizobium phage RHph_TM39]|nr:hypothetical protein EVB32_162 [Rhizobium phage RHph_TM39]QIG77484.1 hypothetical protein EVB61_156 [Rhizobium phage RHph_TM21B]
MILLVRMFLFSVRIYEFFTGDKSGLEVLIKVREDKWDKYKSDLLKDGFVFHEIDGTIRVTNVKFNGRYVEVIATREDAA